MTNRQIYKQLAQVLGHKCYDGKKFIVTSRVGAEHLKLIQRRLLALMEKIDYHRTACDFPAAYVERPQAGVSRLNDFFNVPPPVVDESGIVLTTTRGVF